MKKPGATNPLLQAIPPWLSTHVGGIKKLLVVMTCTLRAMTNTVGGVGRQGWVGAGDGAGSVAGSMAM